MELAQYISDNRPASEPYIRAVYEKLTGFGYTVSRKEAKSGSVLSFTHPGTKRVVANFVSRKSGPQIRLYADGLASYSDELEKLPAAMAQRIAKAPACRRLLDPTKCNSRCLMGYTFTLLGEEHKKCRNNAFLVTMDEESTPAILRLVEREAATRAE